MSLNFKVSDSFNVDELIGRIAQYYQLNGYNVVPLSMGEDSCIEISKGKESFIRYVGLSLCVKLSISKKGGILKISAQGSDWLFKIISFALGVLLVTGIIGTVLVVTGIIGTVKQFSFTKEIGSNINNILKT